MVWNDFFNNFKPINVLFTSNNVEAITRAVAEGLAITFAPDFSPNYNPYSKNSEIVPLSIENHEHMDMSYGWIRPKNKHFSYVGNEFINYIKSELPSRF
ncbi:hypothetical protein ABES02_07815 [Neobacillus pocheonensis]|uniref:hypothetical protein n=1 Tax=Neobacillus pocheonensis TaxID=363869 RepID=UPI003D26D273